MQKGILNNIKSDLSASVVVFLVALPLCLGIGLASTGKPELVFTGVIAGIVGGVVVGSLSGSSLGVSGPAAGLVVIVLSALETLGSFEVFLTAVFLAGFIQLIAGFLRAGIIGYYFPSSVIKGMLAAIGLTLILKEIPHALGYDSDFMGDMALQQPDGHNTFSELYYAVIYSSPGAIVISIVSIAMLIIFEKPTVRHARIFKIVPGALFVVLAGILINIVFGLTAPEWQLKGLHMVQLPVASSASEFISFFRFPDLRGLSNPDVYVVAFTIAIIASIETLLSVEAVDKLDPEKRLTPTNRELKAQGVGNMVSGLIGGLPITQVIVRSSANVTAGGKSKLSTVLHGTMLLISAILIPTYINYIPLASLAAILMLVGYKLSKITLYKGMFRLGWEQFLPFVTTVIAILATDLLRGIGAGMAVAIFFILRKNYKHAYHYVKKRENERELITMKLSEEVTFLNKASIQLSLAELPANSKVIIDGSNSITVDYDVLEIIEEFKRHAAPGKNIEIETVGLREVEVLKH